MRLLRASVPADPPVRQLMHEYSAIIRTDITVSTQSKFATYGKVGQSATATIAPSSPLAVTMDDIEKLVEGYMGYQSNTSFELNIRKMCLWGPIDGDHAPRLAMDLSDISGGLIVTDRCGKDHRARMGISVPFNLWLKPSALKIATVQYDGTSGHLVLDISVAWRVFTL